MSLVAKITALAQTIGDDIQTLLARRSDWNAGPGSDGEILNKPTIPVVDDTIYGVSWDGNTDAPTKNAVYDKIETLGGGGSSIAYFRGQKTTSFTMGTTWASITSYNATNTLIDSGAFTFSDVMGEVTLINTGIYQINVLAEIRNTTINGNYEGRIRLLKNGTEINYTTGGDGHVRSTVNIETSISISAIIETTVANDIIKLESKAYEMNSIDCDWVNFSIIKLA